ncbi:hypothetical protein HNR47_003413 [Methylopila jiangsuensis]|uniref:hypothetical protein n=1 Tax=Methylopila jiangsuensis TaxID=586230 RepID=UPI0022F346A4|nr:hypothetical protein [Methylopila jiangsuensis]MDR6287383.1 hypothetical protein [Methylopila jiangsuensis]
MDVLSKARSTRAWRFCVRVAFALCLVVFGVGDAIERGFSGHVGLDSALTYAVSVESMASVATDHSGIHIDGQSGTVDIDGQTACHACHGSSALPQPMLQVASAPRALGTSPAWASVPSAAGHEPLVDLPPPRA